MHHNSKTYLKRTCKKNYKTTQKVSNQLSEIHLIVYIKLTHV
jgi:hypothetical protein